jgi:very-short-patch-repair endonuclease
MPALPHSGAVLKAVSNGGGSGEAQQMRSLRYVSELAKDLRKKPTPAEEKLWVALRKHQMDGVRFHRQRAWGRYVLDFYAPSVKVAIEVDGEIHQKVEQKEYDRERELDLASHGLQVIRFTSQQILGDSDYCLAEIHKAIMAYKRRVKNTPS